LGNCFQRTREKIILGTEIKTYFLIMPVVFDFSEKNFKNLELHLFSLGLEYLFLLSDGLLLGMRAAHVTQKFVCHTFGISATLCFRDTRHVCGTPKKDIN
jgi:hypothetical protein